jgi:hypothetical protein
LTAVMKEVTRAYELGDLARLVELERSWLAAPGSSEPERDLERSTQQLLQANQELRHQLRALNAELKALRDSVPQPPGRGARGRSNELSSDWLLGESERELAELQSLRDFACAFLNDDVSLSEFLLGPPLGLDEAPSSEQFLADAFGGDFPCGRSRRQRGRRSGLF